jgi:DUF1680 family protein
MADVGALFPRAEYLAAIKSIWKDIVAGKLYVTGGVGSAGNIEGFSTAYDLPNVSSYCETCAAIAMVLWNQRMFLHTGEGKYVDLLERVLYNGFLAGVSMDGTHFFYVNPLESLAGADRSPWFTCACCPSNVVRFLPQIPSYAYAHRAGHLYVNLFLRGTAHAMTVEGPVTIIQDHDYPWEGKITLRVDPGESREFALHIRIPGWARNNPVPGDLYRYLNEFKEPVAIRLNDLAVSFPVEDGYAVLHRVWQPGDIVQLDLPMPVRRTLAREAVADDRAKVALERGPLVYCLEGADTQIGSVWPLVLADSVTLSSNFDRELLGGVQVIRGKAIPVRRTLSGGVLAGKPEEFTAVPYYAWAHRGRHQMEVWLAREASAARPLPAPTVAWLSTVSSSAGRQLEAVTDQLIPKDLEDRSIPVFTLYPKRGTQEWLEMNFSRPQEISRTAVFWYEDGHPGGCRLPIEWTLRYLAGGEWCEISNVHISPGQGVSKLEFEPVMAEGLRLELQLQPSFSGGIFEWVVE